MPENNTDITATEVYNINIANCRMSHEF